MSAIDGTPRPARLSVETASIHGAALLIWALAIWHSWLARGLFLYFGYGRKHSELRGKS